VAVVILLVLTGWDLSADATGLEFCALDEAREHDLVGAMADLRIDRSSDDPSDAPTEPDAHFDDCFCCSHCVEPTPVLLLLEALHALEPLSEVAGGPAPAFRSPLYHPPLTLLG